MELFGISNCDTVRKARNYLDAQQCDYQFIDFRKDGLQIAHLQKWLERSSLSEIVNKRSTSWRALQEQEKTLLSSNEATPAALQLLISQPTLIKRPVLQTADKLLFGFNQAEYQQLV